MSDERGNSKGWRKCFVEKGKKKNLLAWGGGRFDDECNSRLGGKGENLPSQNRHRLAPEEKKVSGGEIGARGAKKLSYQAKLRKLLEERGCTGGERVFNPRTASDHSGRK